MFDLTSKVALVTGAGQHVGRAIAESLASQGATVAINDIVEDRAAEVAREIREGGGRAIAAPADATDRDAVGRMVAAIEAKSGPVDILVSNAGNSGAHRAVPAKFVDMDPSEWTG